MVPVGTLGIHVLTLGSLSDTTAHQISIGNFISCFPQFQYFLSGLLVFVSVYSSIRCMHMPLDVYMSASEVLVSILFSWTSVYP